jgi:hypothetical protein
MSSPGNHVPLFTAARRAAMWRSLRFPEHLYGFNAGLAKAALPLVDQIMRRLRGRWSFARSPRIDFNRRVRGQRPPAARNELLFQSPVCFSLL